MHRLSKRAIGGALAAALVLGSGVVLADITMPNKFVAGGTIKSAEVNANFDALNTGKQDKVIAFTHIATVANTSQNYTTIDNPATNGNPNLILIVTGNRSPGGVAAPFYSGSLSVQFSAGKWTILHDLGPSSPVQDKEAFNVLVLK